MKDRFWCANVQIWPWLAGGLPGHSCHSQWHLHLLMAKNALLHHWLRVGQAPLCGSDGLPHGRVCGPLTQRKAWRRLEYHPGLAARRDGQIWRICESDCIGWVLSRTGCSPKLLETDGFYSASGHLSGWCLWIDVLSTCSVQLGVVLIFVNISMLNWWILGQVLFHVLAYRAVKWLGCRYLDQIVSLFQWYC